MGNFRPLPTKDFEKFLTYHGYQCDRIKGDHYIWKKKGAKRSIPIWGNEKEIPALHLQTSCRTIGCSMDEMYNWINGNC
jgi:predicted RNA binding protein YcfA (HicA-like mRNA interferase family)